MKQRGHVWWSIKNRIWGFKNCDKVDSVVLIWGSEEKCVQHKLTKI